MLKGKRILLGITGGIAAYKAAVLVRLLVRAGADVRVAMTEAATRFVTPVTFQALSNQPVWSDLWDQRVPDAMGHIELSRDRELIVVAPASADFMAKVAHGLADDLLSTLCIARRCPRMLAPAQIAAQIEAFFAPKRLAGKRVLVTAGPTEEPVDPVRVLTNASSGKVGYAVARAAQEAGAEVTLVSGPVSLATPAGVARIDVRTAQEMFEAVKKRAPSSDVFIYVAAMKDGPFCVGFAAESEKLAQHAKEKRAKKNLPLLAANLAQDALGADTNSIVLYDDRGEHRLGTGAKLELARKLVEHVAGMLPQKK